jgi:di/tricarboxylate transporter
MVVLSALAAYFGWLVGRRWERGRIELEQEAHQERAAQRGERSGQIRMTTIQIRR